MLKKEKKIRKLLDYKKYHLCTSSNGEWSLFRKYEDWDLYMSKENKAIMTNETHTEEDLLKFVKKHRKYDMQYFWHAINVLKQIMGWLFFIVGIITNIESLKIVALIVFEFCLIEDVVYLILESKNFRVDLQVQMHKLKQIILLIY